MTRRNFICFLIKLYISQFKLNGVKAKAKEYQRLALEVKT
jgi:hypothetical protein